MKQYYLIHKKRIENILLNGKFKFFNWRALDQENLDFEFIN